MGYVCLRRRKEQIIFCYSKQNVTTTQTVSDVVELSAENAACGACTSRRTLFVFIENLGTVLVVIELIR